MKPHGRDCPDRCSICLGATPRIVVLTDGATLVDGVPQPTAKPTGWMGKRKRGAE